jgi:hypothetical protein
VTTSCNKWFKVKKVRKYFRNCQALGAADIDGWRGREVEELIKDTAIMLANQYMVTDARKVQGGAYVGHLRPSESETISNKLKAEIQRGQNTCRLNCSRTVAVR